MKQTDPQDMTITSATEEELEEFRAELNKQPYAVLGVDPAAPGDEVGLVAMLGEGVKLEMVELARGMAENTPPLPELGFARDWLNERMPDEGGGIVADIRRSLAPKAYKVKPFRLPIACPQCAAQHNRETAQGAVIPDGAILLCSCDTPIRVREEMLAEIVDLKTCPITDFKAVDQARQEAKRARRLWERHQAANREAARQAAKKARGVYR